MLSRPAEAAQQHKHLQSSLGQHICLPPGQTVAGHKHQPQSGLTSRLLAAPEVRAKPLKTEMRLLPGAADYLAACCLGAGGARPPAGCVSPHLLEDGPRGVQDASVLHIATLLDGEAAAHHVQGVGGASWPQCLHQHLP